MYLTGRFLPLTGGSPVTSSHSTTPRLQRTHDVHSMLVICYCCAYMITCAQCCCHVVHRGEGKSQEMTSAAAQHCRKRGTDLHHGLPLPYREKQLTMQGYICHVALQDVEAVTSAILRVFRCLHGSTLQVHCTRAWCRSCAAS